MKSILGFLGALAIAVGILVLGIHPISRDVVLLAIYLALSGAVSLALGYAGWGAGQLDAEIAHHGWFTAPADPDLVFDAERDTVWEKALARRTREL